MRCLKWIGIFIQDEEGAVTVDWVVLTSAIVGLSIAVMLSVGNSTKFTADVVSAKIGLLGNYDSAGGDIAGERDTQVFANTY